MARSLLFLALALLAIARATTPPAAPDAPVDVPEAEVPETPPGVEAVAAEEPVVEGDSAPEELSLTEEVKAQLAELGYEEDEVAELSVEGAAAIIAQGISNPKLAAPEPPPRMERARAAPTSRPAVMSAMKVKGRTAAAGGVAVIAAMRILASILFSKPASPKLPAPVEPVTIISESPFWIDRQLDKFEAWLKNKVGGGR